MSGVGGGGEVVEKGALGTEAAQAVWEVLSQVCGATATWGFIDQQTREFIPEWRFMGTLGAGGKFWRNFSRRPDGTFGELWYVNCYAEDVTPARRAVIAAANERLWEVQQRHLSPTQHPQPANPDADA